MQSIMLAEQLPHFYSSFSVFYKSFLPSQRFCFTGIFFLRKSALQRVCGAAELRYERALNPRELPSSQPSGVAGMDKPCHTKAWMLHKAGASWCDHVAMWIRAAWKALDCHRGLWEQRYLVRSVKD